MCRLPKGASCQTPISRVRRNSSSTDRAFPTLWELCIFSPWSVNAAAFFLFFSRRAISVKHLRRWHFQPRFMHLPVCVLFERSFIVVSQRVVSASLPTREILEANTFLFALFVRRFFFAFYRLGVCVHAKIKMLTSDVRDFSVSECPRSFVSRKPSLFGDCASVSRLTTAFCGDAGRPARHCLAP